MKATWKYARKLCKYVLLALLVGAVCGGGGTAFYHAIALATRLRKGHPWLLYLLPVAGLLTAYLYALLKMEKDPGTDAVLRAAKEEQSVPARLATSAAGPRAGKGPPSRSAGDWAPPSASS